MKTTMLKFNSPSFGELSSKEWLLTNGLGGYASSSLSGANTRRYHGLLVAALNPPTGRTVMVSKVEETLVSPENGEVELSSNRYPGVVHPQGFQFLKSFERLPAPAFFYETNGCNLVKRIVMPQGSNGTTTRYFRKTAISTTTKTGKHPNPPSFTPTTGRLRSGFLFQKANSNRNGPGTKTLSTKRNSTGASTTGKMLSATAVWRWSWQRASRFTSLFRSMKLCRRPALRF
jgi:glycogen debranching enzyme